MGRFVETLAEETDIQIYPLGLTTFKQPELSGAEPDECFYIRRINAVELVKAFRSWVRSQIKK